MKKVLAVMLTAVLVLSLSSCSLLRNRIVNSIRSAAAHFSVEPHETDMEAVDTPEGTAVPIETGDVVTETPEDEAVAPEATDALENTPAPETTSAPDFGTGGGWPEGLPGAIPVFNYGTCQTDMTSKYEVEGSVTYYLQFNGVKKEDVESYAKALKDAGFENTITETNDSYSVMGLISKDNYPSLMVTVSLDAASGNCTVILMVYAPQEDSSNT